jgi:hypothetical protein
MPFRFRKHKGHDLAYDVKIMTSQQRLSRMGFTYPIPGRWRMCTISYSIPRWQDDKQSHLNVDMIDTENYQPA